jgi:Tfp pilus assembly protein PilF
LVVATPGDLPVGAKVAPDTQSASGLEAGGAAAATDAFAAGVEHWPQEPAAWFGLAGARLGRGRTAAAESTYRQRLRIAPTHAATNCTPS